MARAVELRSTRQITNLSYTAGYTGGKTSGLEAGWFGGWSCSRVLRREDLDLGPLDSKLVSVFVDQIDLTIVNARRQLRQRHLELHGQCLAALGYEGIEINRLRFEHLVLATVES